MTTSFRGPSKRGWANNGNNVGAEMCDIEGQPLAEEKINLIVSEVNDECTVSNVELLICIRNHTPDMIINWRWFMGIGYFLNEMLGTLLFAFLQLVASYYFGGVSGTNVFVRSMIIFVAAAATKLIFGRWTTTYLDPIRSFFGALTFIMTRGEKIAKGRTWLELFKVPLFWIAQFLAWLVALTLLGLVTDTDIKTSDCSIPLITPAVCDVYPVATVTTSALAWQEGMGAIIIYGFIVFGERFFYWRYPGIIESSIIFGLGHAVVHLLWSYSSGGSFNFWYWAATSWFSNINDSNGVYYIWPALLGTFLVSVLDVVVYYILTRLVGVRAPIKTAN